ncbi:sigma-54 dependent transcriptional regulator [Ancylomarina sp. 16SWW S1-10-2]|uniref:sigma-54-dependent transcriptional regulator n=1 Tax=Ancylomarina sp. 16SWW S1-10-2 TaxID=2499681 RepID=UPI0012AD2BB7|nr:sigma-54 dependent transcriptional regulator [Ancylomarina sp. 16SWW S1-10-2]MRT92579.1 sigma-54-dependent Fis family transcriptional regulator [Ancylomarina sp. 16SWW S1-10-2]
MIKILIIDDDITFCIMLQAFLEKNNYVVSSISSSVKAKHIIENNYFDIILTDLRMPVINGMDLIPLAKKRNSKTQIIVLTSYANITSAIKSIKRGAFNYIPKPVTPDEILNVIKEALASVSINSPQKEHPNVELPNHLEGKCILANQLKNHIELVAPTTISVLLVGESGTGKENIARLIHQKSKRANYPFIAIDCGAIPDKLAASSLFGHIKGAFTGATVDRIGCFEAANKGTLFLDEVGNLSYNTQIQLLRAIQERSIKPVGSNKEVSVDIRIIAATNENLNQAQENKLFREDLFHRLNEFQINVPPLRKRQTDIMLFAHFFLDQANANLKTSVESFEKSVEIIFNNYKWPGNLREMKNIIKRATLLARGKQITLKEIPSELNFEASLNNTFTLSNTEDESKAIIETLEATNYNKSKAARILNIDRKTLYNKLKRYEIEIPEKV